MIELLSTPPLPGDIIVVVNAYPINPTAGWTQIHPHAAWRTVDGSEFLRSLPVGKRYAFRGSSGFITTVDVSSPTECLDKTTAEYLIVAADTEGT